MAGEPQALRDAISPLKSARKSDEVFDQIARFIRSGRFQPGTKLPPERELATLFNTSRPTVREALYRAELVGLIEVRHGAGSYVMPHNRAKRRTGRSSTSSKKRRIAFPSSSRSAVRWRAGAPRRLPRWQRARTSRR